MSHFVHLALVVSLEVRGHLFRRRFCTTGEGSIVPESVGWVCLLTQGSARELVDGGFAIDDDMDMIKC
jgi:hypothetical protein